MVDLPHNVPGPAQAGAPPPVKGKKAPAPLTKEAAPAKMKITMDDMDDDTLQSILEEIAAKKAVRAANKVIKYTMPGYGSVATLRILLEDNADIPPTGQYIGVNGNGYLLKTGVWCDVPLPIIEVINHAVQMQPITNAAKQVVGWREKMRYPYRVAPGQYSQAA